MEALNNKFGLKLKWFTGLGNANWLMSQDIDADNIVEMDWYDQTKLMHYEDRDESEYDEADDENNSDDDTEERDKANVRIEDKPHIDLIFSPAQHWSGRGVFDRNRSLWGGWIIISGEKRVYFAGDTGKWPFTGYTFI